MSAQENASTLQAFNDAFNIRDWDRATSLCTHDVETVNIPTGQTFHSRQGAREFLQGWAAAFPDGQVRTTNLLGGEQGGAIEFIGAGMHTGALVGPAGEVPPTGRRVELPFCVVAEMENGKIRRQRLSFDTLSMLGQLGLLPQEVTQQG